jgi:alcohol dehydrogenase class IV
VTSLVLPRLTEIGAGCARRLPSVLGQLGVSNPIIVTDAALVEHAVITAPLDALTRAGIEYRIFSNVSPDPTISEVTALVNELTAGDFDAIVAIGGGSPMDAAKAAAVQISYDRPLRELKAPFAADLTSLPLICVPTTAGTGSEVTRFCVITDTETNEKMLITGVGCVAVAALVDVELTLSMPRRVTADTGLDALTHGLEAYLSHRRNAHADVFAISGVRRVLENLRAVWADPGNITARTEMMLAATHAGMAFSASSVALIHGMSRPMGAFFHIPHGMANAMLVAGVVEWTMPHAEARLAELARGAGFAAADSDDAKAARTLVDAIVALAAHVEVPTLSQYGVGRDSWEAVIPVMTEQALASGSPANNPGNPSAADIDQLYHALWA